VKTTCPVPAAECPRSVAFQLAAALLLLLMFTAPAGRARAEQGAHRHGAEGAAEHAHGELFEPTSHRRFDDVEHWVKIFDDPERESWQQPAKLVAALGPGRGQRVADLGTGTGYFLGFLAAAVGPEGTVYAVEVEPSLLAHVRGRVEEAGLVGVIPVLASADNPRLPRAAVDMVLIVDTYHHLPARREYFTRLRDALADGGRVAIVDWRKKELPVGPPVDHKIEESQVVREMDLAGYRLVAAHDFLDYQYVLVFAPS
jgi:ubiquinone/menaquinone biosynthesis C-methylase UbiE